MTGINMWEKFKIKNIILKNRIVRSATNERLGTLDGIITDEYIDVYRTLAKNDVGMIITSHMAVDKYQRADLTHICINEKSNYSKLKRLTEEVHKYDSIIISQISYGGRKAANIFGKNAMTPSESDITSEMTIDNIKECIKKYITAIHIAKETGFDGVQLHLAHGYLLSEFLDPSYNKRNDEYGGNVENRYRIIHEILSGIKELKLDSNFLILVKIDSTSKSEDINFLNEQLEVCKMLEADGVDCIEVSGANYRKYKQSSPYFLENALKIKDIINLPLILVGGFRNSSQINNALNKGIDLISMARPFIADDKFISKLKNNESSKCITCNKCFEIYSTLYKRCIFNKTTSQQLYDNYHKK